ncbi:hypothetical protein MJO28_016004 [Puccinia striiformis f. sp. tritici]|uniref:DNA-directed RNA polymerase subunit n=2 Tax=Puccinia striiformis TaxID=27350 RepID=A0A2S4UTB4_9BASI|nr:hypothetical protein MJO28_016004 [Puccinia striiformis f. sp. tritici]KAI9617291.1 hypothetical protein H4Q26_013160 [Puccinia striiformis f. sp. tritici PST-130]POW00508.1 hypothetical protein PSHT_13007 [Puccinia striiformis]
MIIGSLIFCESCGNLLSLPEHHSRSSTIRCAHCKQSQKFNIQEELAIVTRSNPNAFPSILRQKRTLVQNTTNSAGHQNDPAAAPLMDESCPKCNNPQMRYHTLQLRSADEGTTVFYECPNCRQARSVVKPSHLPIRNTNQVELK